MRCFSACAMVCWMAGLAGCSEGGPIQVSANDGPAMRASGLGSSYAWAENSEAAARNPDVHSVLTATIDEEFSRRGFTKADAKSAAFWIAYRVIRENKTDAGVNPHGETYPRGTLVLQLIDPATKKTIWAASAVAKLLANAPPEVRERRVQEAIHKMIALMPPR